MMLFALHALAAPSEGWPASFDRPEGFERFSVQDLVSVQLLDVNDRYAALKVVHVANLLDGEGEHASIDCSYAGMKANPTAGVDLLVFELATGSHERFTVYKSVFELKDCMRHDASEQALNAAKKRLKAVGLDSAAKPAPLADGSLKRPWGPAKVQLSEKREPNEDGMSQRLTWSVAVEGHVLYTAKHTINLVMGGSGEMKKAGVYSVAGGLVAVEHLSLFSGRGGAYNIVGVTPLLKVP